jgi:hypothetical protein
MLRHTSPGNLSHQSLKLGCCDITDCAARPTVLQDKFDPERVFEPELWSRVAAGEGYALKPKCQLDRSCYCQVGRGGGGEAAKE